MTSRQLCRPAAIALSAIAGWGHIYLGRERFGLLLFTLASASGFLCFSGWLLHLGSYDQAVVAVSTLCFLSLTSYSVVDVWRLTSPRRLERLRRLCDLLLWEGMMNFVRHEDLAAEEKFIQCWRLDRLDVEPVVRAGMVAARRQAFEEAFRLLKSARRLDTELKWRSEIDRELELMQRVRDAGRRDPASRESQSRESA